MCSGNSELEKGSLSELTKRICFRLVLAYNLLPSKIPTMPFTAADLTAFWTDPAQMGIAPRTRAQMALEGLVIPEDFEDFSEIEHLEALMKLLLKPAKVPHGMHGALREVASYVISAKSQIRIDGARMLVLYYIRVGRTLEPADMQWPVIKNFVEQWKALKEKKKADIGIPPKLTKDKQIYKWLEQMNQYLSTYFGVRDAPYTYLTRPDVLPPAVHGPRVIDQPYSEEYTSIEQEMTARVSHDHTLGRSDNATLFQLIEKSVQGHIAAETIAPFKRTQDGRGAFMAIKDQYAGKAVWDRNVKEANARLQTVTWSGNTSQTLQQHTALQRRAYAMLAEAAEHVPTEIPGGRQRTTYLLDSLKTDNPKMLAGMAAIEQCTVKRDSFEDSVTYLLPFDPVAAKTSKAKGLGVNISSTGTKPGGGVAKGTTGVELRWHEPKHFATLSQEQKKELQIWKSSQPKEKAEGGSKRKSGKAKTNEQYKKARLASTKANTTLMEAMSDSHDAQMELMNVKLASMVSGGMASGGVPGVPPAVKVGAVTGFHPGMYGPPPYGPPPMFQQVDPFAAQTEKARVAALNFKSILKPAAKKSAP